MNRIYECNAASSGAVLERPIPQPPAKGAVVKIEYSGVCHSDAHLYAQTLKPGPPFPMVLGHEIAGVVNSIGDGVDEDAETFCVGDRVIVFPWGGCRNCWTCKQNSQHCGNRHGPHAHAYGVFQPGGFQGYVSVLSRWSLVRIPEGIPMDTACLTPCSGITAYHAVQELQSAIEYAITGKGVANVAFVGAGGLSLWATEIIKAIYGEKVKLLVADLEEEKLNDIKEQGADLTVQWTREAQPAEKTKQLVDTFGGKVDAAIDFVNVPSSVESMYGALALNATYALVGIFGGEMPKLPLVRVALTNIRMQGIYCGSQQHLRELFALWTEKKLHGPPIRSIQLEEVAEVLDGMNAGKIQKGRAVIKLH